MENQSFQHFLLNKTILENDSYHSQLQDILRVIRTHLFMEVAFISEFNDGKRVFKYVDTDGQPTSVKVDGSDPLDETYCKKIVDEDLEELIHDTSLSPITNALQVTKNLNIGSYLGVPIKLASGDIYGTLCCFKSEADQSLQMRDLDFVKAFSELAGKLIDSEMRANFGLYEIKQKIEATLQSELIEIHYQPIFSLMNDQTIGFESLARFQSTPYCPPDIWFDEAERVGLGEQLEILAIRNVLKVLHMFSKGTYISINTSPEYIINGAVEKLIANNHANNIIIEITEHSPIDDYAVFRTAFSRLRKKGIRLAIDDAGAGYASLQHILELNPDIIKLDISLIRNIHCDNKRFALAKALTAFAKSIQFDIIAEGIETKEELEAIKRLNIDKVQGYFISKPLPKDKALSLESFSES